MEAYKIENAGYKRVHVKVEDKEIIVVGNHFVDIGAFEWTLLYPAFSIFSASSSEIVFGNKVGNQLKSTIFAILKLYIFSIKNKYGSILYLS